MVGRESSLNMVTPDCQLGLIGERPASGLHKNKVTLGTNANYQSLPLQCNTHKPQQNYTYSDRLFGKPGSSPFNMKQQNYSQHRCITPKNKGKSSYIDETSSGSARDTSCDISCDSLVQQKPSIKHSAKQPINSSIRPSTSTPRRSSTSTSMRTSSGYGKHGYYKTTNTDSFVDETLFSKEDQNQSKVKYDYYGNKIISKVASSSTTNSALSNTNIAAQFNISGSGTSAAPRPTISSRSWTQKVPFEQWMHQSKSGPQKILPSKYQVFSSSYVDESLFGPKPIEADFPAPWENVEEESKKGKPLLFDSTNYSTTVLSATSVTATTKEKGPYLRKSTHKKSNPKPVWK